MLRASSACSSPKLLMTVPTTGPFNSPGELPRRGQNEQQLIAVHAAPKFIHHHHPIAVAVERQADLRAHARHGELQQFRRSRSAAIIDVAAVGRAADGHDLRAEIRQHPRRHFVAGAVGAVDHDLESLQVHARGDRGGAKFLILRAAAIDADRSAQMLRFLRDHRMIQQASISCSTRSDSLLPVASKNLMPLSS